VKLKTKTFECWVDMPDGSRFLVREIPASKQREIEARNKDNATGAVIDGYSFMFRGWDGVTNESGETIPYSQEALREAIEHDLDALNDVMAIFRKKVDAHKESLKASGRD
jgi:hypothetical protein